MNKIDKALFLFNGNQKKEEMEQKLSQTVPVLAKDIERLYVVQTKSLSHLQETCKHYADSVDIIIILGGDGTVHECVNAIASLKKRPALAVLPGGTCNDFSRMLGMPQNLNQAARALVNGQVRAVDIGHSNDRYFLNFWGIGLVTETSVNIDREQKNRFGVLSYFLSTLRTINQAVPFTYKVTAGGEEKQGEAVLIMILNGKFLGTQEIPVHSIDVQDGKLDLLIVKNSSLTMFKELMLINQGDVDPDALTELSHLQAEQIVVESTEEREIDMDGEIHGSTPASIQVLPAYLKMVFVDSYGKNNFHV
ncbi:YegS/Rv2252/BmrU family lipid kinase [Sediminibacillus albus]|uniref:Lipid kinase, YegS/Rv2252/BmrU family n=1 Tax=Sediminibacillus albus TaxID=407036 RepID=A0A1G9ATV7_9BACI|nr:YegS/Rv2252/BmrU family lipid kinase [Sediminibacillus albus]SDK30687.1 lipid kinase, YegS/Rv2252/BmrU family [Sediminibacillus albus]